MSKRQLLLAAVAAAVVVLGVMHVRAPRTELLVGSHVIREPHSHYNQPKRHVVPHHAPAMSQDGHEFFNRPQYAMARRMALAAFRRGETLPQALAGYRRQQQLVAASTGKQSYTQGDQVAGPAQQPWGAGTNQVFRGVASDGGIKGAKGGQQSYTQGDQTGGPAQQPWGAGTNQVFRGVASDGGIKGAKGGQQSYTQGDQTGGPAQQPWGAGTNQVFRGVASDGGIKGANTHKDFQHSKMWKYHGAKKFGKFAKKHHQKLFEAPHVMSGNGSPFRAGNQAAAGQGQSGPGTNQVFQGVASDGGIKGIHKHQAHAACAACGTDAICHRGCAKVQAEKARKAATRQ